MTNATQSNDAATRRPTGLRSADGGDTRRSATEDRNGSTEDRNGSTDSADRPASPNRRVVQATPGWRAVDLAELWRFRELFWILALRDVKVRYKQTVLGAAWALIQPLAFTVLFTIVFGRLAKMDADGVEPKFLFYLAGLLPYQLFSTGMTAGANSLVAAQNMIKKIYFPRLIVPASAVVVSAFDFLISLALLAAVMLFYGRVPPVQVLLLPAFVGLSFLAAVGAGLWLSALNVQFRDVRYVLPFLSQFLLYATPVPWSISTIESPLLRALVGLNPMSGAVDGFRWAALGTPAHWPTIGVSVLVTALLLAGGLFYFRRLERTFADVV